MGKRGVTRLPAMDSVGPDGDHGDRRDALSKHHAKTLWIYWALVLLGVWMLLAPWSFDPAVGAVAPSGGRELWLSLDERVRWMRWSDLASGLLLVVFGLRGLTPNRPVSLWVCACVGGWLGFAPLLFWAPTAASYLNGTLVGALVIALAILVPGMPNMIAYMRMGGAQPAGWSYNPSSWAQRSVLIALGFVGWMVSRSLAAYQMGYAAEVWEPLFGASSRRVLDSDMSHALFISDAGLGAFAYTLEFLMGWMGSPARWRTMPWMVAFFGILVIPLGLVHVFLVISQPVVVGEWCTLCLLAAAVMLPMISLTVDEVIAMVQHLIDARRHGEPLWRTFWKGGPAGDSHDDERSPEALELSTEPRRFLAASLWGFSAPWPLVLSMLLGVGSMLAPAAFGIASSAASVFHVGGALVVVVAVLAMGEPVRAIRFSNVPLGVALAVVPWVVDGGDPLGLMLGSLAGILVALLALPRGARRERYGSWDRFVV